MLERLRSRGHAIADEELTCARTSQVPHKLASYFKCSPLRIRTMKSIRLKRRRAISQLNELAEIMAVDHAKLANHRGGNFWKSLKHDFTGGKASDNRIKC